MHSRAWLTDTLVAASLALVCLSGGWLDGLAAQDPPSWVCEPEPFEDVGALIRHLDSIADETHDPGRLTPRHLVSDALIASFPEQEVPCPRLASDVDRRDAIIQVLEYARDHSESRMAARVMSAGTLLAYRQIDRIGWDPTEFLFDAVSAGETEGARVLALIALIERASDPGIRGRLLAMARRPVGPPSWPDLPVDLIEHAWYTSRGGARLLYDELRSAPGLLEHPRARWEVECGQGHPIPRPMEDPCHPANAPPRTGGGAR